MKHQELLMSLWAFSNFVAFLDYLCYLNYSSDFMIYYIYKSSSLYYQDNLIFCFFSDLIF
jgi:hypothetical protein